MRGKVAKYLPIYRANDRLKKKALRGEKLHDMNTKDRVQLAAILRGKCRWAKLWQRHNQQG